MAELSPEVEQQLASMTAGEFSALTAKVRAPDTAEQLRTIAAKHVSGARLEAVLSVANPAVFAGDDGQIDEAKVARSLGLIFGQPARQFDNFGQQAKLTQVPPTPGEYGAAEAAKRFGTPKDPPPNGRRGNGGAREAQRRYGKRDS